MGSMRTRKRVVPRLRGVSQRGAAILGTRWEQRARALGGPPLTAPLHQDKESVFVTCPNIPKGLRGSDMDVKITRDSIKGVWVWVWVWRCTDRDG